MLISLILLVSLVASFWYRIATADSADDYRRIGVMFRFMAVAVALIPCGYTVLWVYGPGTNLEILQIIILLLALATMLVPRFNLAVLAAVGSVLILVDENNRLPMSLVILVAFLVSVGVGSRFGSFLFSQLFRNRTGSAPSSRVCDS